MRKQPNQLVTAEFRSILTNRKLAIAMLGILCIPILYSSMFLWAFWDPYKQIDHLPVAVVNLDSGAEMDGKDVDLGAEFTKKLQELEEGFAWEFVDSATAKQGLEEQKYYLTIEIPEDFSARAVHVLDQPEELAEIRYSANESFNFLAGQIGSTAMEKLKESLSYAVTESYTQVLFENLQKMSTGFVDASEGASQLADGLRSANEGAKELAEHLATLNSKTGPLTSGIHKLGAGSESLQLGLTEASKGAQELHSGIATLEEKQQQLVTGAEEAVQGSTQLQQGIQELQQASEQLTGDATNLAQGLAQYAEQHPELAEDTMFQQLVLASQQLQTGLTEMKQGQTGVATGLEALKVGNQELAGGLTQFHAALGAVRTGSHALVDGLGTLTNGSQELAQGITQLTQSAAPLQTGVQQLSAGATSLDQGIEELSSGSLELYTALFEAAEQSSKIEGDETLYASFANPVQLQNEPVFTVPNYGTGFSPYFLSLGLYVGALVLTIIYPIKEPVLSPRSGWSWFMSKFSIMALVGVIQGILAALLLLYGLKLEVQLLPAFFLLTILTSLVFMALIQCLVTIFGDVGRFLAILILILQLTTSAGTFPLELIPPALQQINAWLPMTYTVAGFKAAISSGQWPFFWDNTFILVGFLVASALATWAWLGFLHRRNVKAGRGEEHALDLADEK